MKEFQQFKTIDSMTVYGLIVVVITILAFVFSKNFEDPAQVRAYRGAQSLSMQLGTAGKQMRKKQLEKSAGRSVASAKSGVNQAQRLGLFGQNGNIGKDPWGQKFHYKFAAEEGGKVSYVTVWSSGPNMLNDTKGNLKLPGGKSGMAKVLLRGDDIGFSYKIKNQ